VAFHPRYWATLTLFLSACAQAPDHARHTVEDYRADRTLRDTTLKACANDPGTLGKTPDCVNAQSAAALEGAGSLRKLPPLKLDLSKNPLGSRGNPSGPDSRQEP
jgi:hypothetical protein